MRDSTAIRSPQAHDLLPQAIDGVFQFVVFPPQMLDQDFGRDRWDFRRLHINDEFLGARTCGLLSHNSTRRRSARSTERIASSRTRSICRRSRVTHTTGARESARTAVIIRSDRTEN